jgi:hypothetical protein
VKDEDTPREQTYVVVLDAMTVEVEHVADAEIDEMMLQLRDAEDNVLFSARTVEVNCFYLKNSSIQVL